MQFYFGEMALEPVREILKGTVNDVLICRDINSSLEAQYYTLLVVKDRECAKKLMLIFEEENDRVSSDRLPYIACFAQNEFLCYLFEYRMERRLDMFAKGQVLGISSWERICINIVMELISCGMPFPLMALALKKGDIHIEKDNGIFLTSYFDLAGLDEKSDEAECAHLCVEIMLSMRPPISKKIKSAQLMQKKQNKRAYQSLTELFKDIRITAIPVEKSGFKSKFKSFWNKNKDFLFRMLLIICTMLLIFALVVLISQLIFGDIPLFRLFESCFDIIGTRRLN